MSFDGIVFWIVSVAATVIVLGALVLGHEIGHFAAARLSDIRVPEFGIGFPPRAKVLAVRGETEYTLNWLPIGGFVKLEGEDEDSADTRAFGNAGLARQLFVLVAGVAVNLLLAFVLFFFVAWFANPTGAGIASVEPGSPAAAAGLKPGEAIESINGQTYRLLPSLNDASSAMGAELKAHAGQSVVLGVVDAAGARRDVTVQLAQWTKERGALGVGLDLHYAASDPLTALGTAAQSTGRALGVIVDGLGVLGRQLVTNPTQGPAGISGPVGITGDLGAAAQGYGIVYLLILAAILSANLGLVNVLPFPPLDGGRMAVLALKRVAGKRGVSALEATSYLVGFALLLGFIAWISFFDLARLLNGGS